MSGPRRCGSRRPERTAAVGDNSNGYVETDPTGRYGRFDELLGRGAMKSVYRGFDEVRGVEVAWNQANLSDVLRTPDALQRMYSEVHLLSTLRHDAIIAFHASWVDASRRTFNFITELFSSGTLRAYRLRYPRVSLCAVKAWARQILRGLSYLHSHDPPVIHRDLKCDNIFVNGHQGQVKIGDLGLATVLRGARTAHSVIGTPEFMAPELYEEDYNELVDVYSFGMCMLEMLTTEYPYSECSNPAQIYKKVTSGKLPDAFYRVEDKEARRFIGRCLFAASKRPSAEELLLDPFLSLQDDHATSCAPVMVPLPAPACSNGTAKSDGSSDLSSHDHDDEESSEQPPARTDMTITGKLNSEDDTIFLKVQIADETGHVRNIYFPFDIVGDTAMDVANEMVEELDITDRDPSEIAAMIMQEIGRLVPGWVGNGDEQQECYTYADDDEDEDGEHPPYCYLSSSPTSSQGSLCGVGPSASGRSCGPHAGHGHGGWFQDCHCYPLSSDEDDMSSAHSGGKYSALHYCSGNDEVQAEQGSKIKVTRFGPGETLAHQLQRQCSMSPHAGRPRRRGRGSREDDRRTTTRNRSRAYQRYDVHHVARWIEQILPFSLLLLVVFIRQHLQGFFVTIWIAAVMFKSNDILRKQTALKGERKIAVLVGITVIFTIHVFGVYWWYRNDDLLRPLFMLPPKDIPPFWHAIFIIMVNDTMVRQAAMAVKCMLLMYYKNSRGRNYRKQGQMLTLVEYLLLLYRALLPTPVWYRFFLNKEYGSLFSSLTTGLYLTFKLTSVVEKVQSFLAAVKALSRKDVHYGSYATAEQVISTGDMCAICQEKMHVPVLLRCKHIFCEDCVSEWFERERTCPLCRALVKPADIRSFGDGSTSLFFQLF